MTNPATSEIRKSAQALLENRASASRIPKACKYKKQIDQLVYKLYTLTAEEIAIVEVKTISHVMLTAEHTVSL